jgi:competence protein ComEC
VRVIQPNPSFVAHPLAWLAACFACGIAVSRLNHLPPGTALFTGVIAFALGVLFFLLRKERWASVTLMCGFVSAGCALAAVGRQTIEPDRVKNFFEEGLIASGDPVEITGVVERAPEPAPEGFYLTLRVEKFRFKGEERAATGVVWLFAPVRDGAARHEYQALELRHGARVALMVALRRSESFRNPGVSPFTEYLERRGFDATGTIKSPLLIERLEDEPVFLPLALLYEWRQRLLAAISRSFNAETAGVLRAALLGNRFYLTRGAAERFREGGTFHILVISGLHISFIGGLIFLLMRRITRRRAWQFGVSVLFLWAYSLAVGAESSVVRAALMFTVVAFGPVLHRRAGSMNALGCAALILLILRPAELFDPSFQLTFLSVLAIVTLAWPLLKRLEEIGRWRPTGETPHPPLCPHVVRVISETLFWSEREWRRELGQAVYSYRLWKTPLAEILERWRVQRLLRYGFSALVVSLSVQLVLLPLLVLYFHRLSVAASLLNIGVGALMAFVSLASLLALLCAQVSQTLAAPLVWITEQANWLMVHSVDPFARARMASVRLPEYKGWAAALYALYYLPLAALALMLSRWRPLGREAIRREDGRGAFRLTKYAVWISFPALIAVLIFHPLSAGRPDGRLRIDFLDVGQGDAALITMPDGTTLLVDGGGRPNFGAGTTYGSDDDGESFGRDARGIGEMVVSEYLWWRGLDKVDYIIATHADADHMDGLNDVMRNFRVRAALVGRAPPSDAEYKRFSQTAESYGVPIHLVGRGDRLQFGAVVIEVLWPGRAENRDAPSRNDDSVVLRLRFGERRLLLTGDIEKNAESSLVKAEPDLRADVVKVAHHGSKTSSIERFVNAAAPRFAVISVGATSIFGHPHQEVLERWQARGTEILITGRRGTITISTDGEDLRVETFVSD